MFKIWGGYELKIIISSLLTIYNKSKKVRSQAMFCRVLIVAPGIEKAYIIGDSVVTDQAVIDYLDNNYGLPVKWRNIKF